MMAAETTRTLTVTFRAYAEIRKKIIDAGLQNRIREDDAIDLDGIELRAERPGLSSGTRTSTSWTKEGSD